MYKDPDAKAIWWQNLKLFEYTGAFRFLCRVLLGLGWKPVQGLNLGPREDGWDLLEDLEEEVPCEGAWASETWGWEVLKVRIIRIQNPNSD